MDCADGKQGGDGNQCWSAASSVITNSRAPARTALRLGCTVFSAVRKAAPATSLSSPSGFCHNALMLNLRLWLRATQQRGHLFGLEYRRLEFDQTLSLRASRSTSWRAAPATCGGSSPSPRERVNRGIRHLGKTLFEVFKKGTGQLAQGGGGRVVTHRAHRLLSIRHHRAQDHDHLFTGVAKVTWRCTKLLGAGVASTTSGATAVTASGVGNLLVQHHQVFLHPAVIGAARGDRVISASSIITPRVVSTQRICPGPKRPLRTTRALLQ